MFDYRTMFDLSGRTALVVGAGSGIGQAAACALAAFGARVYCADLNAANADETVQQIRTQSGQAESIPLDMRDSSQIKTAINAIESAHPLDILVSTPSINVRKPFLQISDDEFERVVNLNLKGTFMLMREAARGMAERGRGSIIVFASIRAEVVEPALERLDPRRGALQPVGGADVEHEEPVDDPHEGLGVEIGREQLGVARGEPAVAADVEVPALFGGDHADVLAACLGAFALAARDAHLDLVR